MSEKMREEFEAWWSREMNIKEMDLNRCEFPMQKQDFVQPYACHETQRGWLAWKASRESLVIELPSPYAVVGDYAACGGGKAVWDIGYAEKITDRMCEKKYVYCRASLEAAGLKVKP